MITAKFPTIQNEALEIDGFLTSIGLNTELFKYAAEAVCSVVHSENPNYDIADLVLSIRNNAAFRALAEMGADSGIYQQRSRGGKSYLADLDDTLKIMVHNTDAATGLGTHVPAFASKRSRQGTSYVHNEAQGELDFNDTVIEFENKSVSSKQTTLDVCIFAEKIDGDITCRIELLVDAELTDRGHDFEAFDKRFGMTFKSSDFVSESEQDDTEEEEDFSAYISPKNGK